MHHPTALPAIKFITITIPIIIPNPFPSFLPNNTVPPTAYVATCCYGNPVSGNEAGHLQSGTAWRQLLGTTNPITE